VGALLVLAGRAAARLVAEALKPVGLTARQLGALTPLRNGSVTQQALGEALRIDPALVVGLLNALEAEGLVVRRRDPADRRRHIVEISAEGCGRLRAADAAVAAVEDRLLEGCEGSKRDELAAALRRIVENGGTAEPCEAAEPCVRAADAFEGDACDNA
jgi:DNA-binding MarR family transcriptional regulator